MPYSTHDIRKRIVRFGDLRPCRTAFIDAHTPGSHKKENFTIIGGGVSEGTDQFVHLRTPPGFNIGAAGQPPHCRNSLHTHRTAEVFIIHSGTWSFFWGRHGDDGQVILNPGDVINIPTGIFRGFENIGDNHGLIFAVLGGNDAGGGVVWAPEVLAEADAHGLVLGENGRLYDSKQGQTLPQEVRKIAPMPADALDRMPVLRGADMVPRFVARALDMHARALPVRFQSPNPTPDGSPIGEAVVIGSDSNAMIYDKPGFELSCWTTLSDLSASVATRVTGSVADEVLIVHQGHWRLEWGAPTSETNATCDAEEMGSTTERSCAAKCSLLLSPGDTILLPAAWQYTFRPVDNSAAAAAGIAYHVRATGDPAGPTHFE
ncbi:MAG: cupin [Alphaproteobacteria bacterium]|nr:cupin [Alphaproteobacteria bacterium]